MASKKRTSLFKLEDLEIVKRALEFKSYRDSIDFNTYNPKYIVAMDETAVFMGQGAQSTVTCILSIRSDGTKVAPFVIAKGTSSNIENMSNVYVLKSPKAWSTKEVIRKWIDHIFPLVLRGSERGLLIWDAASTHRAQEMKEFLKRRNIDQIMIPSGMTGYLQSLDLTINKPFKDYLRGDINDYINNRMRRNQRGNFIKPNLPEVVSWVRHSWEKIKDSTIINGLIAGYISTEKCFEETFIYKHERIGPLIRDQLARNSELIGKKEIVYDNINEDDELFVIDE